MRRVSGLVLFGLTIALTGGVLLSVLSPQSEAFATEDPTIGGASGAASASVGDRVAVSVSAGGLVDLYAYGLLFTFDPASVAFVSADDPPGIGGTGIAVLQPDGRSVRYLHTELGTSPTTSGSAELVTMRFRTLAADETTIVLAAAEFVDSAGVTTKRVNVGSYAVSIAVRQLAVGDAASSPGPTDGENPLGGRSESGGRSRSTKDSLGSSGTDPRTVLSVAGAAVLAPIVLLGIVLLGIALGGVALCVATRRSRRRGS